MARRPEEFAWLVGGERTRWGYSISPAHEGCVLTETWHFRPQGRAYFVERFGDRAADEAAVRVRAAHDGIPETLRTLRTVLAG